MDLLYIIQNVLSLSYIKRTLNMQWLFKSHLIIFVISPQNDKETE